MPNDSLEVNPTGPPLVLGVVVNLFDGRNQCRLYQELYSP